MREIKFRGSPIEDYGDLKWIEGGIYLNRDDRLAYIYSDDSGVVPVHWDSVGQSAGLKDSEGNEIYDGDAIFWEIDNGVGIESYSAVVYYSENTEKYKGMYKWIVVYLGDFHRGEFDELRTPSRYKDSLQVFGNIYESPELLTEK